MLKLGFIGAGTTGTALAVRLQEKGYPVVAVASRTRSSADKLAARVSGCRSYDSKQEVANSAELVFVTTTDDVIPQVIAEVRWNAGQSVVHCSGADSLDVLEKAKGDGAQVGAFHPLQTFASMTHAIDNLPGSTFALEAEGPLLEVLKKMAGSLDGHWVVLAPGDKVLYHTAAVIACNYMVTLVKMATDLWGFFGVPTAEATQALLPLLRGTINNIENVGLPDCLTGPIARGDLGTIGKHLDALEKRAPAIASTYRDLGLQTIAVALNKGKINKQKAEELRRLLAKSERLDPGGIPMRMMLKGKIHRARVTEANIAYEGSITIDRTLMEAADILPYEMVHVLDVTNGARLETYAIKGEGGEICINGAAARRVRKGDTVIILAYHLVPEEEARYSHPKLVYVNSQNEVVSREP
ncbi:aspartate 1-decarboxylase [Dehalococcoidia bacterium]|nr:aspartate 1-decarboxylase [Dehalococcoidia bacterium]